MENTVPERIYGWEMTKYQNIINMSGKIMKLKFSSEWYRISIKKNTQNNIYKLLLNNP